MSKDSVISAILIGQEPTLALMMVFKKPSISMSDLLSKKVSSLQAKYIRDG